MIIVVIRVVTSQSIIATTKTIIKQTVAVVVMVVVVKESFVANKCYENLETILKASVQANIFCIISNIVTDKNRSSKQHEISCLKTMTDWLNNECKSLQNVHTKGRKRRKKMHSPSKDAIFGGGGGGGGGRRGVLSNK